MLEPMQKDAAIEIAATLLANIYHYEKANGKSEQTTNDENTVLDFKDKIRFKSEKTTWAEVLEFSGEWLEKYPSGNSKRAA